MTGNQVFDVVLIVIVGIAFIIKAVLMTLTFRLKRRIWERK